MFRVLLIIALLLPLSSVAQAVTKGVQNTTFSQAPLGRLGQPFSVLTHFRGCPTLAFFARVGIHYAVIATFDHDTGTHNHFNLGRRCSLTHTGFGS